MSARPRSLYLKGTAREETGRSYGSVHGLLRLVGTEMRPWGFQPKNDD